MCSPQHRWFLNSAERSESVTLAIIPSGLLEGLKHAASRDNLFEDNDVVPHSRSDKQMNIPNGVVTTVEIHGTEQKETDSVHKSPPDHTFKARTSSRSSRSSLQGHPLFAPSIGKKGSNESLVSSTIETAAHLARSSMRSSKSQGPGSSKFKVHSSPCTTLFPSAHHHLFLFVFSTDVLYYSFRCLSFSLSNQRRKVRKMHIMKGASGLGLRIIGGRGSKYGDMGIFIRDIEEGGAAHK